MGWWNVLAVFVGSGLGGVCRYGLSRLIQSWAPTGALFPWGTFGVNVLGCFLIGLFYGLFNNGALANQQVKLLLTVGFCGGFTTFSTFVNENYLLFSGNTAGMITAVGYMLASMVVGFVMLYAGYALTISN